MIGIHSHLRNIIEMGSYLQTDSENGKSACEKFSETLSVPDGRENKNRVFAQILFGYTAGCSSEFA
jgi:hypothetical protein